MWFRNLQVYRLPSPWKIEATALAEQLAGHLFQRCGSSEAVSRGWAAPKPDGALVHTVAGQWLVALRQEERLLPASVIRDELNMRIAALATERGHPPGRRERAELADRIREEFLPRAFTRQRTTWAWIDPQAGWLCVDAASTVRADDFLELLRASVDDLPLRLFETEVSATMAMADWLASGEAPAGFTIDRECELKAPDEEQAVVRYVRHPLEGEEIKEHLAAGKLPTRLALTWNDRLSFVLTAKSEVKRLAFLDIVSDDLEHTAEHADEQFDASFALMTGELARFLPDLVEALGGETDSEAA